MISLQQYVSRNGPIGVGEIAKSPSEGPSNRDRNAPLVQMTRDYGFVVVVVVEDGSPAFQVVVVWLSTGVPSTDVVVLFCCTAPLSQLVDVVVWLGPGAGTTTGAGEATTTRAGSTTTGVEGAV
jgi:hypothetical protein